MEPIGTIRFRFNFIIDQADRDSIKEYMDRVIREVEDNLDDTEIRYQFTNWDIGCELHDALSVQWTVENVPFLDRDERDAIRSVVMHDLRPLIDKYVLDLSEERIL